MNFVDSIRKRDILHGAKKLSPDKILAMGKAYHSEGHWSDAIDFLSLAQADAELKALASDLAQEGDVFLYLKLQRLNSDAASVEQLKETSDKAEQLGKIRYAILGFEALGDAERVAALKEKIAQDKDIVAAQEAEVFMAPNPEEIQHLADE